MHPNEDYPNSWFPSNLSALNESSCKTDSMPAAKETRKLRAILHADVKGYSRLMGEDESFTVRTLKKSREVLFNTVELHGGRIVNAPGDSILAEFSSVLSAVQCAVEIQEQLKRKNAVLPDERKMIFRIGAKFRRQYSKRRRHLW
jgi:class 3 adenylate cyclase